MQNNPNVIDKISLIVINNLLVLASKNYRKFIQVPKSNTSSFIEYNSMLFRAHVECGDLKNASTV